MRKPLHPKAQEQVDSTRAYLKAINKAINKASKKDKHLSVSIKPQELTEFTEPLVKQGASK